MGIDPSDLNEAMRRCLDPKVRKELDIAAGKAGLPNAGLTASEARAKGLRKLERQEQRVLSDWLSLQEGAGKLVFDWSATNRRVTCRVGMPDFKIYRGGRVLFGEMKIDRSRLSSAQRNMHACLLRAGCEVSIWVSADCAIRQIKNWLWTHWREWQPEDAPE
jgi:hypothetical protein